MCSWRVLKVLAAAAVTFLVLFAYYLYLDKRYIVDEVYEGTKLRELTLKEKVTIRVVAPRHLDDLTKFVLEYSICQPVHEIQIVWLHEQNHPDESHFKYQHTHSKVRFIDTYGFSPYDSLYKDVKADTQSILLVDADVFIPCKDLAFAQSVWRSSQNSLVGAFPRHLQWDKDKASVSGWSTLVKQGQYSLMLPAAVLLRSEYLQSMSTSVVASDKWILPAQFRQYVNNNAQCADLALPLWAITAATHSSQVGKALGFEGKIPTESIKSLGEMKVGAFFPPTTPPPPIWIDLPGLDVVGGVELSAPKAVSGEAKTGAQRGNALAPRKLLLRPEQADKCVTDLARLLELSKSNIPVGVYKSTVASTHWVW